MGRPGSRPFNENLDTGRMGFRYPEEAPDERPVIVYRHPFWKDESERLTYEHAVETHPRRPDEGPCAYAARISARVVDQYTKLPAMPHVRMSNRERDSQLMKLRGQIGEE